MYAVRSITPWRVAVTTHHASEYLAEQEQNNRIKNGHKNVMVVDPLCKHRYQHPASYIDEQGVCYCLRCDRCGMITHVDLQPLPVGQYTSLEVEEVPA
jgi:hypothetical protein